MTFIRNLFGRKNESAALAHSNTPVDEPMVLYLAGDGRMQAVKSSGYVPVGYGSRVGLGYITQNAEQYARAAIASVWAANCIALRADTMARFDWFVRDKTSKGKIENHPFTIALGQSKQNIMRLMEKRLLTFGEFFVKPLHNDAGYPSAFLALNNLDMEVDTSFVPQLEFRYTPQGAHKHYTFYPRWSKTANYKDRIAYIHNDNDFDDYRGISRFESVLLEIGIDKDISRTTAAFYKNDARPGLLLFPEQDMTKEQFEEFMDGWNAQFKGTQNTGKTGIVPRAIRDVREFNRAPSIDDVELRESVRREICAAFKVPLSMAGAWDDATYQSLPEQRKFFYEETMIPAAESNAEDLTKELLPFFDDSGDAEVAFDATEILALVENAMEKVEINTKQYQAAGLTLNEYRVANGEEPVKGGDFFIFPNSIVPVRVEELANFEAPNTAPAPEDMVQEEAPPALPAPTQADIEVQPTRHAHSHTHEPVLYVPDETIPVKTVHEEALQELRAWQKFINNGSAQKRDFVVYMIREDIADNLRTVLLNTDDKEAIKAAFKDAETKIAIKQADVVRSNFETEIKTLIDIGKRGDIKRLEFTNRLKAVIKQYSGDAYRAGLTDGGVITERNEPLETEDAAVYEGMLAGQIRFAVSLSAQVYEGKLSDAQASLKPRQWWGKTGQPFYDAGLLSAARNQMVEFVGSIDDNSCDSCKALAGQRHRRRAFAAAGFNPPYGSAIICGDGGLCKHRLISVNSRYRGNLSRVPRG